MMGTRVAIKEFFPKMFCNREDNTSLVIVATQNNRNLVAKLRKKFVDEANAILGMNHPNIVKVYDIFEENGTAYYVMDYIDGLSLRDMVSRYGAMPENWAVGYIFQVAEALKYVHSQNRLHLDIKPGNIMVDAKGHATLIDFGASKHYDMETGESTSTLLGVNTKGYAPIEQSTQSFTNFSPATDIYSLGATLYKLLTGITPPDANLIVAEEETLQPLSNNITPRTRNAVMAAMAMRRKDRPQSVDAFLALLIPASQPPTPKPVKPDNNMTWAILSTAVCCLLTGIPAVLAANKVDQLWEQGRYAEACQKASEAKKWAMWGVLGGVFVWILSFFVGLLCGFLGL